MSEYLKSETLSQDSMIKQYIDRNVKKRYCLTLDLKEDEKSINEYDEWHKRVWPEVIHSITSSGIIGMEIYRIKNRLFMVMDVNDSFSFEMKDKMDANNEVVQKWEELMWRFQKPLPFAKPGEKWILMKKIFKL